MDTERERTEIEMTKQQTSGSNTAESREDSIRREYDFAPDVKLKECRYCRVMIPKKAKVCPNCRMNLKRHWFRNTVAAVFAVMVIGGGGYYLSEHWGIMKDAVASVWRAQDGSAVPAVSVTTVDTAKMAAGAQAVETAEVTSLSEAETEKAAEKDADVSGRAKAESSVDESDSIDAGNNAQQAGDLAAQTADGQKSATDTKDGVPEDAESSMDKVGSVNAENAESSVNEAGSIDAESNVEQAGDSAAQTTDGQKSATDTKDGAPEDAEEEETDAEMAADTANDDRSQAALTKQDNDLTKEAAASVGNGDRQEQAFREECAWIGYKSLLRDTEDYLDVALRVELQVVSQVNGGLFDDNIYYLCKTEDEKDIIRYYIVRDDRETDDTLILEGDVLTVFGQLFGTCKLPADLIETSPTVPAVSMLYYDLTGE